MWDPYIDEIAELLDTPGITKKAVYMYLIDVHKDKQLGTYNGFKTFTCRKILL